MLMCMYVFVFVLYVYIRVFACFGVYSIEDAGRSNQRNKSTMMVAVGIYLPHHHDDDYDENIVDNQIDDSATS